MKIFYCFKHCLRADGSVPETELHVLDNEREGASWHSVRFRLECQLRMHPYRLIGARTVKPSGACFDGKACLHAKILGGSEEEFLSLTDRVSANCCLVLSRVAAAAPGDRLGPVLPADFIKVIPVGKFDNEAKSSW
jgi:hypothetical protein